MSNKSLLPDESVISKIYLLRGQKVMLDRDLAELYGVGTKVLKQAVRRNPKRFPADFMFEMTKEELAAWRSQFVTSNVDKKGLRYTPFCFNEQGVAMLSSVLNSDRAIAVNIQIIRVFTKLRSMMLTHKDLLIKMNELELNISNHDKSIKEIFEYLKKLIKDQDSHSPKEAIGFRQLKKQR